MTQVEDRPAPLVPAEVDLRGYEFMPYYGDRLRDSTLNSRATDAEYRAAHNLWWSSWKQVPAASLPDDDVILARLADLGRDLRTWKKIRDGALRGFVKCSDGRLYHQVLAPLAIEAWDYRQSQSTKAKKRWNGRGRPPADPVASGPELPGMPAAIAAGDARIGKERKETPSISPPFALPEAIKPEVWAAFEEHRKAKRAPMTDHARWLIIGKLDEYFSKLGNDRNAVLNQSIEFGYQGVFPLKKSTIEVAAPPPSKPKEWWETDRGIENKAKELGIPRQETLAMLKARVFIAVGDGPWFSKLDNLVAGYIESFSQQG